MTPVPRSRICGSTACVMAIVPMVLVSNASRTCASGTSSPGDGRPKPALLTSTSMRPAASTAQRMLSTSVTSRGSTRSRPEAGSISGRGVRIVATTFQPRSRKRRAVSRPKPDEQPVMRMVFMSRDPVSG